MTDRSNHSPNAARPSFPEVGYEDWQRQVGDRTADSRKWVEGIEIEPLYTSEHPPASKVSIPLESSDHQDKSWVVCQAFSDQEPRNLNQHLKSDLANGVDGVRLRVDEGAGLSSLADFRQAFEDVDQGWRLLMLESGSHFLPASAVLLSWLRETDLDLTHRSLFLNADPLRVLAAKGSLDGSLASLMADCASLVRYSGTELLNTRSLAVSTAPYREAGADIDLELAVAIAVAVYYLRRMEQEGVSPEVVAPEIAFVTAAGQQTFLEIAKIRALRLMWEGVQRACGIDAISPTWIHSTVLQRSLPGIDPATDLLRLTNASMSAVLGGADSIETPGPPLARLGDPAGAGRRLARNTQNILGLEAHLGRVSDPSAGSYLLEALTGEYAARAWAVFQEIEVKGGVLETLNTGWLQDQIAERWQERCRSIADGQIQILGANAYTDQGISSEWPERVQGTSGQDDIARSAAEETASMDNLTTADGDRWEWCLQGANRGKTVQEMSRALYESPELGSARPLVPHRDGEPYDSESERR